MRFLFVAFALNLLPAASRAQVLTADCLIAASASADLGAAVEGIVDTIRVDRGDTVSEGDELATLESATEISRARLAALRAADLSAVMLADAKAREATDRLARAEALVERGLVRIEEVAAATLDLETADIEREAALRALEIAEGEQALAEAEVERRVIRAPFSGVVIARGMEAGEHYATGDTILTLARVDPLHVDAFLSPGDLGDLGSGDALRVLFETGGQAEVIVDVIDPVIDPATGTLGIRAVLPNPGGLIRAGQTCTLER